MSAPLPLRPQRTRVSRLPTSGPPGRPASGWGPPLTASLPPPSPPAPALSAHPNFSRPRLGPRSGEDSASGAATGARANRRAHPPPLPAQPARVALGTCSALGPRQSARPGGGAGVAGTALSERPHSRPVPGLRARPLAPPPRCSLPTCLRAPPPPLPSSRAAAATAGNTWQWPPPPPLALLSSPLLSAPARAALVRRTAAPGALCRQEAESSRPNPNSQTAPAPAPATPSSGQLRPWPGPKSGLAAGAAEPGDSSPVPAPGPPPLAGSLP